MASVQLHENRIEVEVPHGGATEARPPVTVEEEGGTRQRVLIVCASSPTLLLVYV